MIVYRIFARIILAFFWFFDWVLYSESGNRFWEFMLKMKINWNWLEKKDLEKPIGENVRILILIHSARLDLLKTPLNDEFHTRQNRKKIVKNR